MVTTTIYHVQTSILSTFWVVSSCSPKRTAPSTPHHAVRCTTCPRRLSKAGSKVDEGAAKNIGPPCKPTYLNKATIWGLATHLKHANLDHHPKQYIYIYSAQYIYIYIYRYIYIYTCVYIYTHVIIETTNQNLYLIIFPSKVIAIGQTHKAPFKCQSAWREQPKALRYRSRHVIHNSYP